MKKKAIIRFLGLLALMLLPMTAIHAQENAETVLCMVLTQKDGTVTQFALKDSPVVTYEGENIIVSCGEQQLSTSLAGISNFKFEETVVDAINLVHQVEPQMAFSFNEAVFSGLKAQSAIRVYTIDGKAVSTAKAGSDGMARIDLGNLPRGIYIIRTSTQSYKIKK